MKKPAGGNHRRASAPMLVAAVGAWNACLPRGVDVSAWLGEFGGGEQGGVPRCRYAPPCEIDPSERHVMPTASQRRVTRVR